MKKIVRKTMFVLSFMGLFTFGAPKQAKAAPPEYPRTVEVCCDDGTCHYCVCEYEGQEKEWKEVLCPASNQGDV